MELSVVTDMSIDTLGAISKGSASVTVASVAEVVDGVVVVLRLELKFKIKFCKEKSKFKTLLGFVHGFCLENWQNFQLTNF